MRKPDEIALYAAMREAGPRRGEFPEELGCRLGIHHKRTLGLLLKWSNEGWWDYCVSANTGWFTPDAPEFLAAYGAKSKGRA